MKNSRAILAMLLSAAMTEAAAVSLSADGLGQALVYPYYTVRSAGGNAFNTYISVVNHTADAKALRVRFREGRNGREALAFNLYLSANDTWTAAIVPTADGARLLTADRSCTDPAIAEAAAGLDFTTAGFIGANADGSGITEDRTREGFVEILEMAQLTGASAAAVTQRPGGTPESCATIRAGTPSVGTPTGGLSGTLTLINVASGLDFTLPADALAELTTATFFRPPTDPYPAFDASEVTPVSVVMHDGHVYRSAWASGVDAVSAVFMRSSWNGEFVLDAETASLSDVVVSLPTRHFYAGATFTRAPFTRTARWDGFRCPGGGEELDFLALDRESSAHPPVCTITPCPPPPAGRALCASAAVGTLVNERIAASQPPDGPSALLGSVTGGLLSGVILAPAFANGWIRLTPEASASNVLLSLASSQRIHVATGAVEPGRHRHEGLPVTGFSARLFNNGTLSCAGASCQGNYGGAFPLTYRRSLSRQP